MKVLVVDDERLIRWVFEKSLSKLGHTVISTQNAEDALAALRNHTFDILFVDMKLPDRPGTTIIDIIPHLRYRPKKIVACSAYFNSNQQENLKGKGVMTLEKPFTLNQLGSILNGVTANG